MKKALLILLVGALLLQALPAFAQEAQETNGVKKYAVQFSLAGSLGGKNSFFEGEAVGAFKLGTVNNNTDLFTQVGVMTNAYNGNWEYGASVGFGGRKEGTMIYLFLDTLYSHNRPWLQARALFKFYFGDWVEFSASYSYGLSNAVKLENGMEMRIENLVRANLSIFLTSWLELFGNVRSIGNIGQKHLVFNTGLKIWPVKWLSVDLGYSGDTLGPTNPGDSLADWSIVSNMFTRGFRVMVNLFGEKPIRRSSNVQPRGIPVFPMSEARVAITQGAPRESEEDTTPQPITIFMEYERWNGGDGYKPDTYFPSLVLYRGATLYLSEKFNTKMSETFNKSINIETNTIYTGYIVDLAMLDNVALHVWINSVYAINLNGNNTPYGAFKFYVKNDGTVVFLSQ